MLRRFALVLLPAALAVAQTTPNSITVTATRSPVNAQPDLVTFEIDLTTSLSASREEVIGSLRGVGVTATFATVRTIEQYNPDGDRPTTVLAWAFLLSDALTNMKATLEKLAAAQKSVAQLKNGFAMSFSVSGTGVSAKAQQSQTCSLPDLIAEARAEAQKLAAAAATGLGQILAISGATLGPDPSNSSAFAPPTYFPVCSLTVKFALGTL